MKKIVVVQTWGIGDMIMTTPMLRLLKLHPSRLHVTVIAGSEAAAAVIAESELCDAVKSISFRNSSSASILRFALGLRREHYDAALVATRLSPRIAWLLKAVSGIPIVAGDGTGRKGWGYTHWRRVDSSSHRIPSNLAIVRLLFPQATATPGLYFHVDEAARAEAEAFWRSNRMQGRTVLGLHPGGGEQECKEKRLPPRLCIGIMRRFLAHHPAGRAIVFFGPEDQDVRPAVECDDDRVLVADRLPVRTVGALIARCGTFVSGDTGLAHIAAALGVPAVTVAGPTDMRQTMPWGTVHHIVTTRKALSCRPCYGTDLFGRCPFERECMVTIPEEDVCDVLFPSVSV
jgi:ADP-heptose:LPS heptosyltransferase